jgi:hypothetical protein
MHGAPLVDIESADRFKACLEDAVKGLSEALLVAEAGCSSDEFLKIRTSIGDLIARVDGLLHESVHNVGPTRDGSSPERNDKP